VKALFLKPSQIERSIYVINKTLHRQ